MILHVNESNIRIITDEMILRAEMVLGRFLFGIVAVGTGWVSLPRAGRESELSK
jgi:hypothetical protein